LDNSSGWDDDVLESIVVDADKKEEMLEACLELVLSSVVVIEAAFTPVVVEVAALPLVVVEPELTLVAVVVVCAVVGGVMVRVPRSRVREALPR